jgi:hypothetical protein
MTIGPHGQMTHFAKSRQWKGGLFPSAIAAALVVLPCIASAGPPFITDDPEPVELHNWEVYLGTYDQRTSAGYSGTAPHIEINYGALPDLQLHTIVPLAYDRPVDGPSHAGLGDIELGAKWRFVQESDTMPQIGIFPLLEVPTGDEHRGLGSGYDQVFLPVWIQKTAGDWTAYGGGGYWINPGSGNRNYWFTGIVVQYQICKPLAIGGELFHATPSTTSESSSSGFNIGAIFDCTEHVHLMASAGRDFSGPDYMLAYAALQLTF